MDDRLSVDYFYALQKFTDELVARQDVKQTVPFYISPRKEIDHYVENKIFEVDEDNKVWWHKVRVIEDQAFGRGLKYNNEGVDKPRFS